MRHGTLTKKGDRVELRFERRLSHPPQKVWRALTENAELSHWFPARIDGPREAGAALRFVFPGQDASAMSGKLTVFDPPRVLEYTWEGEVLRWELKPEGSGCLLVFTTIPSDRAQATRDAQGWHFCLDNLEALLDGRPAAKHDKDVFARLNAEYTARFGLGGFPAFLRTGANRVAATSLDIPGLEASVFDGVDGTQLVLCHATQDADTGEHLQDFDEYLVVLEGSYVLSLNGNEMPLKAGSEYIVPKGARTSGRYAAGTRTIHAFGGRGLKRAEAK